MNYSNTSCRVSELSQQLLARRLCIAVAESCTGGLLAAYLTALPGSSNWFERGFVTYSLDAKRELLGVRADLLEAVGAVSIPVAEAMALGALRHSRAQISVSTTGIAGPEGGEDATPVGTVCFALAFADKIEYSQCCYFPPSFSRAHLRELACRQALDMVCDFLQGSVEEVL